MKKYDSYKDSGIEWMGQIPSHWKIMPIKHIKSKEEFAFVDGPFGSNLKSEHYIENGDVYVIESGFITTGKFLFKKFKTISLSHFETIKRSSCKEGDIIIAKIGFNFGMCAELPKLDKESVVSGNSLKITLDHNLLLNQIFIDLMNLAKNKNAYIGLVQETAQPALSLSGLNNFKLSVPPLSEQKMIADYLDRKCREIDAAVAKVEKELELLDELKQSEISKAVTKGLNPNVSFKPSGIDWIGQIPSHWEIIKVKHKYKMLTGFTPATKTPEYYDKENGYIWITIGDMNSEEIVDSINKISFKYISEFMPEISPKGSLLYSFKLSVGQVAFCGKDMYTNEAIATFLQNPEIDLKFLKYSSNLIINNANINIYGAPIMNQELIKNAPIVFPPLSEQKEIADYLDRRCGEIDSLKEKLKQKREKLQELRQSLISEVVTGKRKVI
ncbi:MAG: restriction endonuclease subunit S [Muribaculaceae bacterium]|nr:restriction endonuclease subunit S [Muribaculaceae bacterium]